MKFPSPLLPGILLRRYKRFLADVRLDTGEELTVHCANPGSMKGCAEAGWRVLISESPNPRRKLPHTLELVHNGICWIGVNPAFANAIVEEGLRAGMVPELSGYQVFKREAAFGDSTRFDFLLTRGAEKCLLEVKSATLVGEDGFSAFPDAVTARGLKHIRELLSARDAGYRAALLFVVQRSDGAAGFRAAHEIDPAYAAALRDAHGRGLEIFCHLALVDPSGVALSSKRLELKV
jgi:sugar fermentation stimulation protein A